MTKPLSVFLILTAVTLFVLLADRPRALKARRRKLLLIAAPAWGVVVCFLVFSLTQRNPLFLAVDFDDVGEVKRLLLKNPRLLNRTTLRGKTPLHRAVELSNSNMVVLLLGAGADANARDGAGITPLLEASRTGNLPVAKILIDGGADVNAIGGRHNDSALHVAAFNGRAELVELLVLRGADPTMENMLGRTPIQEAEQMKRTNVIAVFSHQQRKAGTP